MERRQSIKAVARSTAIGGTFQASVRPVDVLAMGDMGRAPDPPRPEVAQVQVGRGVQLFALRRARQGHRLAEEGRDGDPALLWDSTTPQFRRCRVGNAVFAGVREDVPEVCGIAERRFAGRWRRESSHATENGIP